MVLDMVGMLSFAVPAADWSWTWSVIFAIYVFSDGGLSVVARLLPDWS